MQKKLLALAVLGVFAAPLAAQAQGSNVTIYGDLKPSVDSVKVGGDRGTFVQENNSLFGFKGSEDLGGGLKAIFQLESSLDFDDRDGTLTGRDSWLGLAGAFGSLTVGNHQSAYVKGFASFDPMSDTIGDYNNIMGVYGPGAADFNHRWKNSFYYTSPKFGGFQLLASYALNSESTTDDPTRNPDSSYDSKDNVWSVEGSYSGGPFSIRAAYEHQGYGFAGTDDRLDDASSWKIGASYKIQALTLSAIYERMKLDATGYDDSTNHYFLGGKYSLGKVDLLASYSHASDLTDDDGADAFALGVAYNFSKRTNIKALYSRVNNDNNGTYGFDSGGYFSDNAGDDVSGFSVRMEHKF